MDRSDAYDARWGKVGAPLAARAVPGVLGDERQYSLVEILAIWAAAAVPMALLGWVMAPLIGDRIDLGVGQENRAAFTRAGLLTVGLIWQFVLVGAIILRDEGNLRWSTVRTRCWLDAPRDPRTGRAGGKLWLWLVPLIVVFAALQTVPLQDLWDEALPFLAEPVEYSFGELMVSDQRKAALEGAWHILGLFVVLGIFNTVLGEELLFRGILLPKMRGVFGKGDWLANSVLFGLYHLHQPWTIVGSIIGGALCLALPSRRYRSAWLGIAVHSSQSVFFFAVVLGLVLGLA
jgi:membrane protease YdiL (CAAX protease family)